MEENKLELETALVNKESAGFLQAARELIVSNDQELDIANENLKGTKSLQKRIREWFKKHKTKARETLNGLVQDEKELLDPLIKTEDIIKGKMGPYMEERRRKREEAEAVARKAQEEAQAVLRRAQEEAEAKALAIEEEKQRKAREALHDGELKKAEKILEEETKVFIPEMEDVPAPAEIIVPEEKKLEGTHLRTTWRWELENIAIVPRHLLMLDRSAVNKEVQAKRGDTKIPGIRVFPKTGVASKED